MKPLLIALAFARALDVTSTCVALHRGAGVEANPLLPSTCGAQIAVHTGIGVGQIVLLAIVQKKHPKLAKVLASVSIGVEVGAFAHNLQVIR